METRNPVEVVNIRRSVIIVELWRSEVARRLKFSRNLCFLEKRPLTVKFSKFCPESTDRRVVFKFC